MSISEKKMVKLISGENEVFEVEKSAAMLSVTLRDVIADGCTDAGISVPIINSETLVKVIEYCEKHVGVKQHTKRGKALLGDDDDDIEKLDLINAWDRELVNVEPNGLKKLISAANYLNIRSLLDLTCQAMADFLAVKDTEFIMKFLNLGCDSTDGGLEAYPKEDVPFLDMID